MELRWRKLARSYKLAEQLQTVTSNSKQESGELTNRLELLKRRLEAVIRRTRVGALIQVKNAAQRN
jgi:hypothetical protein